MRYLGLYPAVLVSSLCLLTFEVQAQSPSTFYVRAGASGVGTGTDWNNAYPSLPAALQRGATYYIADGTYSSYTFDDAASSSTLITIKKATAADHGTDTGWASSYGDGYWTENTTPVNGGGVSFGSLQFTTGYWTLDGNTNTVGRYGIQVRPATSNMGSTLWMRYHQSTFNFYDITINNGSAYCTGDSACVQGFGGDVAGPMLVSNMEIWNSIQDPLGVSNCNNCTYEYMYIHNRVGGYGVHGDGFYTFQDRGTQTLRYSRIDWDGQQLWFGGYDTAHSHGCWYIYGNVFYGGGTSGQAIRSHSSGRPINCLYLYNNTIANQNTASINVSGPVSQGGSYNNVFFSVPAPGFFGRPHDYNWFQSGLSTSGEAHAQSGTNPFANSANDDFRLLGPTAAGSALSAPYNTDPGGRTRGADGVWDRGAFEFTGGTTETVPAPPTNVRILR